MHQVQLLKKYGLSITGAKGQSLLIDENVQSKIVSFIDPKPQDSIIEIGPGLGAITDLILREGPSLVAVEQDSRFVEILKSELAGQYPQLKVIHQDVLKTSFQKFAKQSHELRVVGNIPYYITSQILIHLLEQRFWIDDVVIMIQKEYAERIFAQPGSKSYGRISLLMRLNADVEWGFDVSRNCFSPRPDVDSSVVRFKMRRSFPKGFDQEMFSFVTKAAFGQRRKNILNALAQGFAGRLTKDACKKILERTQIAEQERAEMLLLKDFIRLSEEFGKALKDSNLTGIG